MSGDTDPTELLQGHFLVLGHTFHSSPSPVPAGLEETRRLGDIPTGSRNCYAFGSKVGVGQAVSDWPRKVMIAVSAQ